MTTRERLLALLGTTALLGYLATATGIIHGVPRLTLLIGFAIGPLAIIGILRLVATLRPDTGGATLSLARHFLTTAFILFTVMVVLQQMVRLQFQDFLAAAPDAATITALRTVFKGVNLVQLGIDVAFDLFYTLGMITMALVLYGHPGFGRLVGLLGVGTAAALLILNLAAFPHVPAESGLVDLGPVTGLWWLLVIVLQVRRVRRRPVLISPS